MSQTAGAATADQYVFYADTEVDGCTESNAGNINLIVPSHSLQSLEGELGVRFTQAVLATETSKVSGYVALSVRHHFDSDDQQITTSFLTAATPFTTQVEGFDGTSGVLDTGLVGTVTDSVAFNFNYRGIVGSDDFQHVGSGQLNYKY